MIWLQAYGAVGETLQQLADFGVFDYVLPFLLVFALVFGLLSKVKMFEDNKAVPLIIGVTIGALSLVNGIVPAFFHEIFPNLGVALAILITGLILVGVFIPFEKENGKWGWGNYIFLGVGGVLFFVVVISALSSYNLFQMYWFQRYWGAIVVLIIIIAAISFIVAMSKERTPQH
jgi:hypothetical protein